MPSSESGGSVDSISKCKVKSAIHVKQDERRKSAGSSDENSCDDGTHYKRNKSKCSNVKENSRSDKRGHYSDDSDEKRRYVKRSRRYDRGDEEYDERDRNHHISRYNDEGHHRSSRRERVVDHDSQRGRERYVDLDMPRSDGEDSNLNFESTTQKKKRRDEVVEEADHAVEQAEPKKKKTIEDIFTKAGGAYIPPSKLRQMQEGINDKTSVAYQRMAWEALKKSINGLVNKVNISNIDFIVTEMLSENIVRGRGLVSQSIIRAQVASPTFTNVYASFVAIINSKFPNIGELILRRLIINFRKSFKRNDKLVCINSAKFIGHLVNQQVSHELLALEILTLMLHNHTSDSVEVAISFLKEVGQKLTEVSPKGMNAIFESLRNILHDAQTDKRVQYMIEVIFHTRKDGFAQFPAVIADLDKVEEEEQITHLLRLEDAGSAEDILNVFKLDPNYVENEEKYKAIKTDLLGGDSSDDSSGDESGSEDDDEEDGGEEGKSESTQIIDMTETNLVALRRQIYLTIQSSLDFEECAHKMMKMNIKDGQQHEFCLMIVECCAQQRSYEKFYGLLGQRFCLLRKEFMQQFIIIFHEQYENCHHLETNKLRNTAKLFSHLLHSDGIPWTVLEVIKLNEDDTTSSSRIFIKILFQELAEYLGIQKFLQRLKDPVIAMCLDGVFPVDDPKNTRFAINFFTAIGLGVLTDALREHLKSMPKVSTIAQQVAAAGLDGSSSSSSSSSSDSDSSSSSSSDSESDKGSGKKREEKSSLHRKRKKSLSVEQRREDKASREDKKESSKQKSRHRSNSEDRTRSPRKHK